MLDKNLLTFDDAFPDGRIVGDHGLSPDELAESIDEITQYIANLKKIKNYAQ